MTRYMLDTNTVSYFLREHPKVTKRILSVPMASLSISAITEGELLFGLAKRPEAKRLKFAVHEFLLRVEVMPWDSSTAQHYGTARANLEAQGKSIAPLDMQIGCHALSLPAILVTNDQAFHHMTGLQIEDWTV